MFLPSGNKIDVLVSGLGEGGRPLAIDFRVTYPLQLDASRGTFAHNEKEKNDKHKAECDAQGWDFAPFVLDTYGGFGPAAKSVFGRLVKLADELGGAYDQWRHNWTSASFPTHWLQRFSLVIARANYEMHRAVVAPSPNLLSHLA